jgi:GNAT superfamily N-acetyltransferase
MIKCISENLTENDLDLFKNIHSATIGQLYPYSTLLTAESLIIKHKLGVDPNGYFTLKKTIWKAVGQDNQVLAFTVITEKRGGSIKSGPMLVLPRYREQGVASGFIVRVEEEYTSRGYRKAYLTGNVKSKATFFAAINAGYKIEIHLKDHYDLPPKN